MNESKPQMNWKRSLIAVAAVIPIVGLLYFGLTIDASVVKSRSPLAGAVAPTFELAQLDAEGDVSLAAHRGSIVVLNFWASWCPPCRLEHPELIRVATEYEPRGVVFYGVLHSDTERAARRFLEELGALPYPTLVQGDRHVGIDYGVRGLPESFVIDRNGVVAYKKTGPFMPYELNPVLDSLLALQ